MITNEDIKKLKVIFATKQDLKNFATKEELADSTTEMKRHFDVVAEDLKSSISLLAEQMMGRRCPIECEEKVELLTVDVSVLKNRLSVVEEKIGK